MGSPAAAQVLGIVYCEACGEDTIPSEQTGRCLFCDAALVKPIKRPRPSRRRTKPRCACGHFAVDHDLLARCLRCSCVSMSLEAIGAS